MTLLLAPPRTSPLPDEVPGIFVADAPKAEAYCTCDPPHGNCMRCDNGHQMYTCRYGCSL